MSTEKGENSGGHAMKQEKILFLVNNAGNSKNVAYYQSKMKMPMDSGIFKRNSLEDENNAYSGYAFGEIERISGR